MMVGLQGGGLDETKFSHDPMVLAATENGPKMVRSGGLRGDPAESDLNLLNRENQWHLGNGLVKSWRDEKHLSRNFVARSGLPDGCSELD